MKRLSVSMILVAMAGCGGGHRAQCDALVAKVNAVSDDVTKSGTVGKDDAMSSLARTVARGKSALSALALGEASLRQDRDRYVAVLARIEKGATDFSAATTRKDEVAAQHALDVIQSIAGDESAAVARINHDCAQR